jgi:hypothetical protein
MPRITANSPGRVLETRPIEAADLAAMGPRRGSLTAIRDRHHAIARLAAQGWSARRIAESLGLNVIGLRQMLRDPAMTELIAEFHAEMDAGALEHIDETARIMNRCRNMAWGLIQDRLEDSVNGGQELPLSWLSSIAGDSADRTGYAKRSEQVNINVDMASQLGRAIARSSRADDYRQGTITAKYAELGPELSSPISRAVEQRPLPAPVLTQGSEVPQAPVPASAPPAHTVIRRRA